MLLELLLLLLLWMPLLLLELLLLFMALMPPVLLLLELLLLFMVLLAPVLLLLLLLLLETSAPSISSYTVANTGNRVLFAVAATSSCAVVLTRVIGTVAFTTTEPDEICVTSIDVCNTPAREDSSFANCLANVGIVNAL